MVTTLDPSTGVSSGGTDVLVVGGHFFNTTTAACVFDITTVPAKFLSDQAMLCTSPPHSPGAVSVEVTLNGVDLSFSGTIYVFYPVAVVHSIWPELGPASEGGTVITVQGEGFKNSAELSCKFGNIAGVTALWLSSTALLCKTPRHRPGLVTIQVTNNGMDFSSTAVKYMYVNNPTLESLQPTKVFETGQIPVFVKGFNFQNTTMLSCRFGAVAVRGSFIAPRLVACMAPSHSAQPHLQRKLGIFSVEVSINGVDYTDSGKTVEYIQASPEGQFTHNWESSLSPNGTYCSGVGNLNFTICKPGSFQPSSGANRCLLCPVGYICPGVFFFYSKFMKDFLNRILPKISS